MSSNKSLDEDAQNSRAAQLNRYPAKYKDMNTKESSHKKTIRQIIFRIHNLWSTKRYDEIGEYLSEKVVIVPPGSDNRVYGRDSYVQSYRDYDESDVTGEFSPGESEIDVIGNAAVAVCPFYVKYEFEGKEYQESGLDILVFSQINGEWKIVWRTIQTESSQ